MKTESIRNCQSKATIEFLLSKNGKPQDVNVVAKAVNGHSSKKLNELLVSRGSQLRRFSETKYDRYFGTKREHGLVGKVTQMFVAGDRTPKELIALDLMGREIRNRGFKRSKDCGFDIATKQRLLPTSELRAIEQAKQPKLLSSNPKPDGR